MCLYVCVSVCVYIALSRSLVANILDRIFSYKTLNKLPQQSIEMTSLSKFEKEIDLMTSQRFLCFSIRHTPVFYFLTILLKLTWFIIQLFCFKFNGKTMFSVDIIYPISTLKKKTENRLNGNFRNLKNETLIHVDLEHLITNMAIFGRLLSNWPLFNPFTASHEHSSYLKCAPCVPATNIVRA